MLVPKPVLLTLAFVVAQSFVPQTACDRRVPPPSQNDPWANAPITETITTSDGVRLGVQVLLTNVQIPWALAFAPDGRLFFTERPGRVRVVQNGSLLAQPALTLTDSAGVVLLDNVQAGGGHNGARVRFGPDGKLYVTFGDANVPGYAQTLSIYAGKILRLNDDGSTPADNPFGSPVWTWGHRHPQGIDWHPQTGEMWATEHGQSGNDELNLIARGQNYGWPAIEAGQTRPDMITPVLFYGFPAIAPSGLSFYTSTRIPQFARNIFFATLNGMHVHRVVLSASNPRLPVAEERLFEGRFGRIRDVITGPDGALYFCTSNRDGRTTPVATDDRIARIIPVQ